MLKACNKTTETMSLHREWWSRNRVLLHALKVHLGQSGRIVSGLTAGNEMEKVLPVPTSLCTLTDPWWTRAMCLTIARPKPVPPNSRLRALSTR